MRHRVQKIIANNGFCSRRHAEELIKDGKVSVNNKIITIGDSADEEKDTIRVGSNIIRPVKKIYLALNKPRGFITTSDDMYDRKKVVDLIDLKERVFAVGRLDRDATGILFMTNDGDFSNQVMHPRNMIEKTYLVVLDKPLTKEHKASIESGVKLHDCFIHGIIKILDKKRVELSIHQGRNKIVKRIFNHFNYNVDELCRIRIGTVELGNIKPGRFRFLTDKELKQFE